MSKAVTRLVALAPCVALLAVASPASATSTISFPSTLNLTNRVLVDVPVTYDCPMLGTYPYSSGSVSVEQGAGKNVAQGSASLQLTCDGVAHTQVVSVAAGSGGYYPSGSPPFHGGPAIAEASLSTCGYTGFTYVCDNASTGWQPVKLS